MNGARWWVRDRATGTFRGDGRAFHAALTKAQILANLRANAPADVEILDADTDARPPDAPLPAAVVALNTKRARLAELRAKGWAALVLVEKDEARVLAFDIGEPSPPAA